MSRGVVLKRLNVLLTNALPPPAILIREEPVPVAILTSFEYFLKCFNYFITDLDVLGERFLGIKLYS